MTSQSPRIYTYKITFEEVPYYYYGVHKERKYNEYYMGSPVTHKWVWNFYTPKKQILQVFPFTDEGWIEAQEVERRLIRPVFNSDTWCLNKNCQGVLSIDQKIKGGKIGGSKSSSTRKALKIGIFGLTDEQRIENGKKGDVEGKRLGGIKSANLAYKNKSGIYALTSIERKENGKKYGKFGGIKAFKNKSGIHALTFEERSENSKKSVLKVNSQRWMCLETGYISTSAGVVSYQKARNIDTSKRVRVS